jgi:general nucleoside transport system ATP-binding protein
MLAARGIFKRFGRTVALDRVNFNARSGEIHALVGENGAGKSTLVNIFAGRLRSDAGEATLDGVALRSGSPADVLRAGIAAVYQSSLLFERMTWEENLALGRFGDRSRRLDLTDVAAHARQLADSLGFDLPPPRSIIGQLSVPERARLEIVRALSFDPRVLILDEPTGVLAAQELANFLAMLRRLRAEGRIVVLVTHRLAEALAVADRITVLRQGKLVSESMASKTNETKLAREMIGDLPDEAGPPAHHEPNAAPLLVINRLILEHAHRRLLDEISVTVAAGEIVGIAGVDGNGQRELVDIMAGIRTASAGTVHLSADATASGGTAVAVIPQDRDLDGLVLGMTLWENLLLAHALRQRAGCIRGWLRRDRASDYCAGLLKLFHIRASGPSVRAAELSGGNRQRLVAARAFASGARVIVAHDLCRGLDLHAMAAVHRMLREYVAGGGAVLLISSDLDELLTLCGRIAVISRGRLVEVAPADRDAVRLGLLMAGTPP